MVESCINYQQGTPHKVFLVQTVTQASLEVSRAEGGGARPASLHPLCSRLVRSQLPGHHACFGSHCCLSRAAGISGFSLVSGGSPGAVRCFHRDTHTLIVFMRTIIRKWINVLSLGRLLPLSPSETYRNHFQKFLKTGTMFLICCSNLVLRNILHCLYLKTSRSFDQNEG